MRVWALIIAGMFLGTGLIFPKSLSSLNSIWFQFGLLLHKDKQDPGLKQDYTQAFELD